MLRHFLALLLLLPASALSQPLACPPIPLVGADAAAVREASAPDAWGGPRDGSETTLSERIANYRIHAVLDADKHRIEGQQQLTWRNRSQQPVCAVYLHLYLNAFASSGSTFMQERAAEGFAFRSGASLGEDERGHIRLKHIRQGSRALKWTFVQPDGGAASDRTVVRLDLSRPVPAGGELVLDMAFTSQLPRIIARTGHAGSFHLVAQWFPKIGVLELPGERGATATRWNVHEFHLHSEFYADFGHYDVSIDVPAEYTVGATGELVEKRSRNGRTVYRHVQGDVHDFAWTADKRTAKPLQALWQYPGGEPVKVQVLYPPELADNAAAVLKATLASLTYFSRTLGRYPYRTVTAVIPPAEAAEAGGMEYPTFFTALAIPGYRPGGYEQYLLEFVTLHELGHNYFQGILASNEFEEPLLDEGLNQYWNNRMLRDSGQQVVLVPGWLARWWRFPRISAAEFERLGTELAAPEDALGANSWQRLSSRSYYSVYSRGATLFEGIERQVGREAMDRAMRLYYQRWKFRHPSLADLEAALIEGTGKPDIIRRNFAQHVHAALPVDDAIHTFTSHQQRDEDRPTLASASPRWRTEIIIRRKGADVPQTLRITFADGSEELLHFSGERPWFRHVLLRPSQAVRAELDPGGLYPLDRSRNDNQRNLSPDPYAKRFVGSRLLALMQGLLALFMGA